MIGIGTSNLVVGALADAYTYQEVFAYLTCCTLLAMTMTVPALLLLKLNSFRLLPKSSTTVIKTVSLILTCH